MPHFQIAWKVKFRAGTITFKTIVGSTTFPLPPQLAVLASLEDGVQEIGRYDDHGVLLILTLVDKA